MERYVKVKDWLNEMQWLIPFENIINTIEGLEKSVIKENLSLFEFEYLILVLNYISLKSWGPGEFICKCYTEPLELYVFLAEKPISQAMPLPMTLAFLNYWYVPSNLANCLRKWHVPPNSTVLNTNVSTKIAKELSVILKEIILYLPDLKMKFFLPIPFIITKGVIGTLQVSGLNLGRSNKSSLPGHKGGSSGNGEGETGPISIKIIGHRNTNQEINIEKLAEIAGSIFSSMQSAEISSSSAQPHMPHIIVPKLPARSSIEINISNFLNKNFAIPKTSFKKVGSVLARAILGKNIVAKLVKTRSLSSRRSTLAFSIFLTVALSSLIFINRRTLISLFKFRNLYKWNERKIVIECYKTMLDNVSKFAEKKSFAETPREYLEKVYGKIPELLFFNLSKATEIYEVVRYGNKAPSKEDVEFCMRILRERNFAK